MKKRVTLQQVAEEVGVSKSAASFALTGRTDQRIAQSTVDKVKAAARKLGYRPNMAAKTLRTGTSGTVALVSDFVTTTSLANAMVSGVLAELRDCGKLLYTVDTEGQPEMEFRLMQTLLDRQVDGIVYASMFTRKVTMPRVAEHVPTVLLNCLDEDMPAAPAVIPDEYEAGRSVVKVLLNAGHGDDIAFLGQLPTGVTGGPQWRGWHPWALEERLSGIKTELTQAGFSLKRIYKTEGWTVEAGRIVAQRLLSERKPLPTAVICVNDAIAFGFMQILQLNGLRVPDDISFVSFDGSEWADAAIPALTTVCLPQERMGRRVVRLMLEGGKGIEREPMPLRAGGTVGAPVVR